MKGKKVKIYSEADGRVSMGKILDINFKEYKREGMDMTIQTSAAVDVGSFGSFDCPACKFSGDKVITRAADDLAGCVMALGSLIDLRKKNIPVISIFTRAEEVGFIGCIAVLESKMLDPKYARVVSLEASRTLPGALIGEGPVVRLGDASSIFNSDLNRYMSKVALELKKSDKTFKYQKRLMDGGSCEATAFDVYRYRTMGLSVPLGNYHNQGTRGPAPEIISLSDIENGRKLLVKVASDHKAFDLATKEIFQRLRNLYVQLKPNLTKNIDRFT